MYYEYMLHYLQWVTLTPALCVGLDLLCLRETED